MPKVIPVTIPDEAFTDATAAALLLHVPPLTVLDKPIVNPVHTLVEPLTVPAVGAGFTVTIADTPQLVARR